MATCPSNNLPRFILTDIVNSAVVSVDHIGVVPWALLLWVVWLILHSIYRKCFEGLLVRIGVPEPQRQRMVKIYWRLAFAGISIPFALQNLPLPEGTLGSNVISILESFPKTLLIAEPPTFHTKFTYVLITGFYLNTVCETCIEHGVKSWEFFLHESFTIFFISTFPLRSVYFGIAVIATLNVEKCLHEISRMLCCIGSIVQSRILLRTASAVLLLQTFVWCSIYFYVLPKFFLVPTIYKLREGGDGSHISLLLLLTISFGSYYLNEIGCSPLTKLLFNHIYGNDRALERVLFGVNEMTEEEIIIENQINHSMERTLHHKQAQRKAQNRTPDHSKNRENLRLMYQTVKCVIRIRRKLKKIRDQKEREALCDASSFKDGKMETN